MKVHTKKINKIIIIGGTYAARVCELFSYFTNEQKCLFLLSLYFVVIFILSTTSIWKSFLFFFWSENKCARFIYTIKSVACINLLYYNVFFIAVEQLEEKNIRKKRN